MRAPPAAFNYTADTSAELGHPFMPFEPLGQVDNPAVMAALRGANESQGGRPQPWPATAASPGGRRQACPPLYPGLLAVMCAVVLAGLVYLLGAQPLPLLVARFGRRGSAARGALPPSGPHKV